MCVTMKKSAGRTASTTSDTGDTSSKQQQAQRKENYKCVCARTHTRAIDIMHVSTCCTHVCVCVCVCVCVSACEWSVCMCVCARVPMAASTVAVGPTHH